MALCETGGCWCGAMWQVCPQTAGLEPGFYRRRGWESCCSGKRKQCLNITVQIDTRLLFPGFVVMEIRLGSKTNLQSLLINKDLRNFFSGGARHLFRRDKTTSLHRLPNKPVLACTQKRDHVTALFAVWSINRRGRKHNKTHLPSVILIQAQHQSHWLTATLLSNQCKWIQRDVEVSFYQAPLLLTNTQASTGQTVWQAGKPV